MTAQKGSDMLIKLGDDASPQVFTTIAGLRTKNMTLNGETVDVTNSDSLEKWRELLEGAGIKSAEVSGSGVFTDAEVHADAVSATLNGSIRDNQIVVPGLGTFEGPFQFTQLQFAGEHNGEVTFDVTLASAGKIAFTAS